MGGADTAADGLRTRIAAATRIRCDDVLVADGDNAISLRQAAVEQIALDVFGRADIGGKLITRRMVAERLNELSAHSDGCRCGLCHLVPSVTVTKVWRCASRWQCDVNQTRLLARR